MVLSSLLVIGKHSSRREYGGCTDVYVRSTKRKSGTVITSQSASDEANITVITEYYRDIAMLIWYEMAFLSNIKPQMYTPVFLK